MADSAPPRPELYVSADIEADGPIPGRFSMISFGFAVAGRFDGGAFERLDPTARTFYRELRPISDRFEPAALATSGLDRDRLIRDGEDPARAMTDAADWVRTVAGPDRPVLVAYPLAYDWSFLAWYFATYAETGSPFGFSSCLDMKTMYWLKSGVLMDRANKRFMPRGLLGERPHTHHALDDAIEQADMFANLLAWPGPDR